MRRPDQIPEKLVPVHADSTVTPQSLSGSVDPGHSKPRGTLPNEFGRYRIARLLGHGAMGAVYLAEDKQLQRLVALKTPQFGRPDEHELLDRFYREARLAATLRHPNICPIHDVGCIAGTHFISMAFIEGKPLSEIVGAGKQYSERRAALLVRKLALALDEAHSRGVVHRDLKPANIMIDKRGEPIVMDFGLARQMNTSDSSRITKVGQILGTPAYMSPEQVTADSQRIGPSSDIYALGVILFQLLTGRLPFEGMVLSVLAQIASEDAPKPSGFRPGLDQRLEEICLKAMAKEMDDRYRSMKEFAKALTEYAVGTGNKEIVAGTAGTAAAQESEVTVSRRETPGKPGESGNRPASATVDDASFQASSFQAWLRSPRVSRAALAGAATMLIGVLFYEAYRIQTNRVQVTLESTMANDSESSAVAKPITEPQWLPLFNDKDLAGWEKMNSATTQWTVEGDMLTGFNQGRGILSGIPGVADNSALAYLARPFSDFHLRCETKLCHGVTCMFYLRNGWSEEVVDGKSVRRAKGYAVFIAGSDEPSPDWRLTGTVAALGIGKEPQILQRAKQIALRPEQWFTLEIKMRGHEVRVLIDGSEVVNLENNLYSSGLIALICRADRTSVRIRNLEILDLTGVAADAQDATPPVTDNSR